MKKSKFYYIVIVLFLSMSSVTYSQIGGGRDSYYFDADGDGFGDPNSTPVSFPMNSSYVDNDDDCDDTDPNIGAGSLWFIDSDGDGFGETTNTMVSCTQPTGYANNNTDQCPGQYGLDNGCPGQVGPSSDHNYIHTTTYRAPYTLGLENNAPDSLKIETIGYFDGLGRAVQNIAIRAGGDNQDLITHIQYDIVGRQDKDYLPYAGLTNEGAYRDDAETSTSSFYAQKFQFTTNPYAEKAFEASPLNRVLEQAAPGTNWELGTKGFSKYTDGNTIKLDYQTNKPEGVNSQNIRSYTVSLSADYTPTLNSVSYYTDTTLVKTITKDENWKEMDGYNKTTEEFKDKLGRVILKRAYNNDQEHDTYYVFDRYGNLTFVLPPLSEPTGDKPNATELDELCYQYKYDKRNRIIEKKIPGKDWEYIVYDNLDRPVLTQDANQRKINSNEPTDKWSFIKYDAFSRVVYTGIYDSNSSQTSLQASYDAKNTPESNYETKVTSGTGFEGTYYTNNDFPSTGIEILTVNYYDNYTFNLDGGINPGTVYLKPIVTAVKSYPTGSRVKVLGTSSWITTVTYYDDKLRPIYIYSNNAYLGTTDIIESKLDFMANVLESTTTHKKTGKTDIVSVDTFTYDAMNRPKKHTQIINSQAEELIAENTYDELGLLEKKDVGHLASDTNNRLQEIRYTYNIRGWLTQINDVNDMGTNLFGYTIKYAEGAASLYNGNISEIQWKTQSADNSLKTYTYGYDDLNRLTSAIDNTGHYNLTSVVYDKNGNIENLTRTGRKVLTPDPDTSTDWGNMDVLTYDYQTSSNQLRKVTDASGITFGFNDGANSTNEYTYDLNGNLLRDYNKGVTSDIGYNHLNLPTQVTVNGQNISYVYDALGVKLRKIVGSATTDYAGNHVYENNTLQFFNTPEGYVQPNGSVYEYVYQYKDHLGNIRLSYSDNVLKNGTIDQSEIIEENNYYPFGLKHKGYNTYVSPNGNSTAQKFKFNGIELEDNTGLYEMDVRSYDPALARWTSIDPVTHHSMSPYNAFDNNPVVWADPSGADGESLGGAILGVNAFTEDVAMKAGFSKGGLTITGSSGGGTRRTFVTGNDDGTYKVTGGEKRGNDNGIYVGDKNGEKIGETVTSHSFVGSNEKPVVGAVIDLNSTEGQDFIDNEIIKVNPTLLGYMIAGSENNDLDFKNRDIDKRDSELSQLQYRYRGSIASNGKVGSARDFGNIGAGIVAARHGLTWNDARTGFDLYQNRRRLYKFLLYYGQAHLYSTILRPEPITTQKAQRFGFDIGKKLPSNKKNKARFRRFGEY